MFSSYPRASLAFHIYCSRCALCVSASLIGIVIAVFVSLLVSLREDDEFSEEERQ